MSETIREHSDLLGQQIYKNAKKKFPSITHADAVLMGTVPSQGPNNLVRLVH